MASHFTRTTAGPHVTSSVRSSQSTTVTHSSTSGSSGTKFTHGSLQGTIPIHTGQQQYITGPTPYVTTSTTRYTGATPSILGQTSIGAQGSLLTGGSLLGSLMPSSGLMPMTGLLPTTGLLPSAGLMQHQPMYYSRVAAPMAVSAPMGLAAPAERPAAAAASSRMQSSMTINGVHCEGALSLTDTAIVEAQNLFVGVAPFVLDHASLEVTPELSVVTRNPDIKFHLPTLPEGAPISLNQLRAMAGLDATATLHVALPGQQSSVLSQEPDGVIKISNGLQGVSAAGTVLGTLRM